MTSEGTIDWVGKSGNKYKYTIYSIGTAFKKAPGNYVFAKETKKDTFRPVYIGETEDLSERFDSHHKMPCIIRNKATHITVNMGETSAIKRRAEEKDLIDGKNPICND